MKKTLAVLMMLLLLAMLIVSCEADGPVIHKVTFDSGNGNEAKVESVIDGEKTVKPADPVMTGYTFLGWYDGDTLFDFETSVKQDYSLTAKWQILTFTVSFDANGGKGSYGSQIIDYGGKVDTTKVSNPTRTGCTFLGWYDGESNVDLTTLTVTKNYELKAKWNIPTYTVSFNPDGGTPASYENKTVECGNTIEASAVANPTKTGYTFDGWYNGNDMFVFGTTTVTGDITLKAKWTIQTFTVSFNVNEGTGTYENQTINYGGKVDTSKVSDPTRTGYGFMGWYNGDSKFDLENTTITATISLTAKWGYTVTFNSDGGTPASYENKTVECGNTIEASAVANPTKTGYTFDGWYNGNDMFVFGTTTVDGNIELKAKWNINTYTVSFNLNGGTSTTTYDSKNVEYNKTIENAPTEPTNGDYTFGGWYNGSAKFEFGTTKVTDNIELKAKWGYKVTFNSNGGSSVDFQVIEANDTATKPAKNPTKDNSIFDKWTTDQEGNSDYNFGDAVTGNITLYAQWTTLVAGKTVLYLGTSGGQPIPWIVLDIDNTNKRALLFSQNVLEKQSFYNADINKKYFHYYSSTIHTRLKDYFSNDYGLDRNYMCNVDVGGEDTNVGSGDEKVFLLSSTEVKKYFSGDTARSGANVSWWLRTTAYNFKICYVSTSGSICEGNDGMDPHNPFGIRPAFWLNLEFPVSFSNNH